MSKIWAGRTGGKVNAAADGFNSSISFDKRLYQQDINGSIAHVIMLASKGIITQQESDALVEGLSGIAEDIHSFVEETLTARVGEVGKKLHTARSRNDQVALDLRMYIRSETAEISEGLKALIGVITDKAEEYKNAVCPGYTHLQRAQPITFGHQLLAYSFMFLRDLERLCDCKKRVNICPIGCCALAGTTYDTDRRSEAASLGFDGICLNSIDGVSDRDFCAEFIFCCALIQTHLSRLAEELILWTSWEFRFVELSDEFTTGSSIMPQKKNSDIAELARGKTGRVYGDLVAILTVLKGLPLAYNKDMQEDKESVFDALDTVKSCLAVFTPMLATMKALTGNMKSAASKGFINATDLADYLVKKGRPFRSAYKICGQVVSYCVKNGKTLETLAIQEYKTFDELFENDLYNDIDITNCVNKRISEGGTAVSSVEKQIKEVRERLNGGSDACKIV